MIMEKEDMKTNAKRKVVISGATGFIGRWLVLRFLQEGTECVLLARRGRRPALETWWSERGGDVGLVTWVASDLAEDNLGLSERDERLFGGADAFYHLGAAFTWGLDRDTARKTNVDATLLFLQMAREASAKHFVYVSGYLVACEEHQARHGLKDSASWDEATWVAFYARHGAYEASKVEAHYRLEDQVQDEECTIVFINPSTVIGHSQSGELNQRDGFASLVESTRKGFMMVAPGRTEDWLPLVTVDTVSEFMSRVHDIDPPNGAQYTLLNQETPKIKPMMKAVAKALGVSSPLFHVPPGFVQTMLKFGGEAITGVSAESVSFLLPYEYNTDTAEEAFGQLGMVHPDVLEAMNRSVSWLKENPQ